MRYNNMSLRGLVWTLVVASLAWTCSAAMAGALTKGLEAAYGAAGDQAKLPTLISLSRQADLATLRLRLQANIGSSASEKHATVVESLQAISTSSQTETKASFEILERNGMVEGIEYFWISNLIRANVSRAGAELIANFEAVEEVGLDESVRIIEVPSTSPSDVKLLSSEPSLQAMHVRDIWSAGVTGAGSIVAVVGTPFQSSHPAFADRMKGAEGLLVSSFCGDATPIMLGAAVGCDKQKGDTIGVAPDANWRLLPLVCGGEPKLSDVIRVMQGSQNGDFVNVPDVIVQGWELGDSCASGAPQYVWNVFKNVEEMGTALVWAAGEHGTLGRGSVALPAAMSNTEQTFFAVGAIASDGKTVQASSSRGPSPCDRKSIKPELTAIGEARSAGESGFLSARSSLVAAGYVAGTMALMRQVNPDITPSALKITLQLSATDMGVVGEDNDFGYGLLNINAAVEMAASSSETGVVNGTVRYGGERVAGARIFLVGHSGSYTAVSNADGQFRFTQIPAEKKFALYVARFGYKDFTAPDSVATTKQREFSVGVDLERGIADDAEIDRGFIIGVEGDNATAGVWSRAVPVGSNENGATVQVSEDATAYGSFCFVTGNGGSTSELAAANDVDGGRTTLRSPLFRLDNLADAKLKFKYAYSNDRGPQKGGDFFRVQISNNAGATWTNLIQTSVSTNGWQEALFKIEDFVAPTAEMLVQFVAEDNAPPSLVEAAVDDIFIEGRPDAPEPPKNLSLTPTDTGVSLSWNRSEGASAYKVYMSGQAGHVFAPENYFTNVADTFLFVPYDQIPYDQFYFQVTAVK
ncbi:MAG: S8 family serine peptidase [bacterium]|nr:S8 family serine peptidase [bacterium]